ncbi:unnamed protein product [Cylicocyclus nassatus]|uniref:Uncharacterized protein n=1 Tax=Cylicocyclus nassatus TaxID=53992 RepID=A0AA36H300_CYLNA|nr:unnamed protein product [Cylicocyclus nassatus]
MIATLVMEAFNSYVESCHTIKALLPEWCDHRVKVEAELRELTHQFDEWKVEAERAGIASMAVLRSDAREGPTPVTGCAFKFVCSDSLRKRIDDTVALLEQAKPLTENLIKAIEAFQEKENLFLEKIDYGSFKDCREFVLPSDTNVYPLLAVVWRLSRRKFSELDFFPSMLGILLNLKESLHLARTVRNIPNLAVEGIQGRYEVAFQLHNLASCVKWECHHLPHLIMEYLPIP